MLILLFLLFFLQKPFKALTKEFDPDHEEEERFRHHSFSKGDDRTNGPLYIYTPT